MSDLTARDGAAALGIEQSARILVVGLGNPGRQYTQTRHNIGFTVVDELADRQSITLKQRRFEGMFGEGHLATRRLALLEPQTYMNLSGNAVSSALDYLNLSPSQLVVIHDDIDLPLGRLRFKLGGGSGGHRGITSIDQALGDRGYYRLRIGVGRSQRGSVVSHVLSAFAQDEIEVLKLVLKAALEGLVCLFEGGLVLAQNLVNGADFRPQLEPSTGTSSKEAPKELDNTGPLRSERTDT